MTQYQRLSASDADLVETVRQAKQHSGNLPRADFAEAMDAQIELGFRAIERGGPYTYRGYIAEYDQHMWLDSAGNARWSNTLRQHDLFLLHLKPGEVVPWLYSGQAVEADTIAR